MRAIVNVVPMKLIHLMLNTPRGRQITLRVVPFAVLIAVALPLIILMLLVGSRLGLIVWVAAIAVLAVFTFWWQSHKERQLITGVQEIAKRLRLEPEPSASWQRMQVSGEFRDKVEKARIANDQPLIVGSIDRYGRAYSSFGELPTFTPVSPEDFQPRVRFSLDILLRGDHLLLRKDFAVNVPSLVSRTVNRLRRGPTEWSYSGRKCFGRDWYFLALLKEAGAAVPQVVNTDRDNYVLEVDFIAGNTVEELIESRATPDPIDSLDRQKEIIRTSSSAIVGDVLPAGFIDQLRKQLDLAHSIGVVSIDMSYQHIIVNPLSGSPVQVDFERAIQLSCSDKLFHHKRDRDRRDFNRLYGTDLLTERVARRRLASHNWSEPMDLGFGLTLGSYWSTRSGTGRWQREIDPAISDLIQERSILEISGGDGLYACLISHSGARRVVAVIDDQEERDKSELLRRVFEWRTLCEFQIEIVDSVNDEQFDLVTCFSPTPENIVRLGKVLPQTEKTIIRVERDSHANWAVQLDDFGFSIESKIKLSRGSVLLYAARL